MTSVSPFVPRRFEGSGAASRSPGSRTPPSLPASSSLGSPPTTGPKIYPCHSYVGVTLRPWGETAGVGTCGVEEVLGVS